MTGIVIVLVTVALIVLALEPAHRRHPRITARSGADLFTPVEQLRRRGHTLV